MMNRYLDESELKIDGKNIISKHTKTIDYKNESSKNKQKLIQDFSERSKKNIATSKDPVFKEKTKKKIESLDTKDEFEQAIEHTRLEDFDR